MRDRIAAKRYGGAVFDIAMEAGELEIVQDQIRRLAEAAKQVPAIIRGLSDGRVEFRDREMACREIARELKLGRTAGNLLLVLTRRGCVPLLKEIADDFDERFHSFNNLTRAKAKVADGRRAGEVKQKVEEILAARLKFKVSCEVEVDPSIVGGFVVQVGDRRFDASVKGAFEKMKEEFLHPR